MNDIRELIEHWRNKANWSHGKIQTECFDQCADQPEAAMPVGTIITEDESTQPDEELNIIYRIPTWPNGHMVWSDLQIGKGYNAWDGHIWWSIPKGMFEPPEDK